MKAQLIGWNRITSKKNGKDYVILNFVGDPIPSDRGDGLFVKQVFVNPDIIPADLKAGMVEVEKGGWSDYIQSIKNITEK